MAHGTHTHWWMTINNYDDTDLALLAQGYPDHIRQLVYTLEKGEQGTPHVQAYIKMKRDCRLSHMRKLFPNASKLGFCDSAEYKLNAQRYAQKLDATAQSPAVIQNGDPLHTIEGIVRQVINRIMDDYPECEDLQLARKYVERALVVEDYSRAKVFVSATYKQMWQNFGNAMYECLFHQRQAQVLKDHLERRVSFQDTHTHTHEDEKFSHAGGITTDAEAGSQQDGSQDSEQEQGEDDEGYDDSSSSETEASDTSDDSGCSESDAESQDGD